MRYPNPENIVRYGGGMPQYVPYLTSQNGAPGIPIHNHRGYIDRHGNGVTDNVASHYHNIRYGRVVPSDRDGHTHRMTGLPTGAG